MKKNYKQECKNLLVQLDEANKEIEWLRKNLEFESYNTEACRSWATYYQDIVFGRKSSQWLIEERLARQSKRRTHERSD